ncbi:MAG: type I DNA topoisomerase [Aliidongia sp.]
MNVVVVESPAKAKTINKYLGSDYTVLASYGHVRDLPAKDGSVRPDDDFAMDWEVDDRAEKRLREIVQALKGADMLYLATDPDREGEAISWHVREELKRRRALKDIPVRRVVFNEVTKSAVLEAFQNARELNDELIDAYMARRALDYLVGFTLSPVLWRKLPGSRSAGRVQSVALRLICDREGEIEAFKAREYWSVESTFRTAERATFSARLTHLDGKKLERFDLPDEASAKAAVTAIESEPGYSVYRVENRQVRRNPPPPFTTSTLQQEASRKLGFGTSRTMQLAQRLYEGINLGGETVGLITYMRTDGVSLSADAVGSTRALIERDYGPNYRPAQPRYYKTVAKNAQEAHEAIRPTDAFRRPADVAHFLDSDQLRLYELIWKRTLACQMESAVLDQATIDINGAAGRASFRATGSVIRFDGFLKLYQEGRDDEEDEENRRLPALKAQDALDRLDVKPEQHFTEPPPRYTEASLVKRLEELGIGRPSTYASIIQVLMDRDYVKLEKKRFEPEDRGRLVTAFLQRFFERYVEYSFTADLENLLDDISGGRADWKGLSDEAGLPGPPLRRFVLARLSRANHYLGRVDHPVRRARPVFHRHQAARRRDGAANGAARAALGCTVDGDLPAGGRRRPRRRRRNPEHQCHHRHPDEPRLGRPDRAAPGSARSRLGQYRDGRAGAGRLDRSASLRADADRADRRLLLSESRPLQAAAARRLDSAWAGSAVPRPRSDARGGACAGCAAAGGHDLPLRRQLVGARAHRRHAAGAADTILRHGVDPRHHHGDGRAGRPRTGHAAGLWRKPGVRHRHLSGRREDNRHAAAIGDLSDPDQERRRRPAPAALRDRAGLRRAARRRCDSRDLGRAGLSDRPRLSGLPAYRRRRRRRAGRRNPAHAGAAGAAECCGKPVPPPLSL